MSSNEGTLLNRLFDIISLGTDVPPRRPVMVAPSALDPKEIIAHLNRTPYEFVLHHPLPDPMPPIGFTPDDFAEPFPFKMWGAPVFYSEGTGVLNDLFEKTLRDRVQSKLGLPSETFRKVNWAGISSDTSLVNQSRVNAPLREMAAAFCKIVEDDLLARIGRPGYHIETIEVVGRGYQGRRVLGGSMRQRKRRHQLAFLPVHKKVSKFVEVKWALEAPSPLKNNLPPKE